MSEESFVYLTLTIAFLFLGLIFVVHQFSKFRKTRWDLIKNGKRTYNIFLLTFIILFVAIIMNIYELGIAVIGL